MHNGWYSFVTEDSMGTTGETQVESVDLMMIMYRVISWFC